MAAAEWRRSCRGAAAAGIGRCHSRVSVGAGIYRRHPRILGYPCVDRDLRATGLHRALATGQRLTTTSRSKAARHRAPRATHLPRARGRVGEPLARGRTPDARRSAPPATLRRIALCLAGVAIAGDRCAAALGHDASQHGRACLHTQGRARGSEARTLERGSTVARARLGRSRRGVALFDRGVHAARSCVREATTAVTGGDRERGSHRKGADRPAPWTGHRGAVRALSTEPRRLHHRTMQRGLPSDQRAGRGAPPLRAPAVRPARAKIRTSHGPALGAPQVRRSVCWKQNTVRAEDGRIDVGHQRCCFAISAHGPVGSSWR